MPQYHRERASQRIPKELIEADFEIGFNLVDMATAAFEQADRTSASRALHDAEDVLLDIERRLKLIDSLDSESFGPLVGELKRAIGLANAHET